MRPPHYSSTSRCFQFRHDLWRNDYRPVALLNREKLTYQEEWTILARQNPPHAVRFAPTTKMLATGCLGDGLRVFDIDVDCEALVHRIVDYILHHFDYNENVPTRYRVNSSRLLMVYAAEQGEPRKSYVRNTQTGYAVEVLGHGQQFVVDGVHESGYPIQWQNSLLDVPRNKLVKLTDQQVQDFLTFCKDLLCADNQTWHPSNEPMPVMQPTGQEWCLADISAILDSIQNFGLDWQRWFDVAAGVFHASAGSQAGYEAFCDWSRKCSGHSARNTERLWRGLHKNPPTSITAGKLIYLARRFDPDWEQPSRFGLTGLRTIFIKDSNK